MGIGRREVLAGTAAVSVGMLASRLVAAGTAAPAPIVETASGKVQGFLSGRIHAFKGIPYGASTGGAARFKAPSRPAPWSGVKQAVSFGHQSPQNMGFTPVLAPQAPASEGYSEDCLVLNVWTPDAGSQRRRPVMFWCHGGGFFQESGSWPWVDGAALARRGDVVVVTLNHRLNLFGYLHLGDIGGEDYAASGNAGMLDLVLALEWVRDNIAAFGGDPGNVTIFGESGGGAKVSTLLAMPSAAGLFHKAAIQSGAHLKVLERQEANDLAAGFLAMLGIGRERLNELQDIPAATLLSTMDRYLATLPPGLGGLRMGFSPVLDGRYVTHHPFDPLASPLADHIPLIVGCTAHEMSLFSLRDPDAFTLDWAHLQARVAGMTDAGRAEEIIALYRAAEPESSPSRIFFEIGTDRSMRANAIFAAQSKAKQAAPVFAYLFAWESPAMGGALGATHTVEIPFVFDNTDIPVEMTTGGAEEKALAAKVSDAWISFARTGNPSHPGIGQWPAYDEAGRATMILDRDPRAEQDPDRAKRLLWQSMTIG